MKFFLFLAVLLATLIASGALACNPPQPTGVPNATPTVAPTVVNPTDGVLTVEEFISNALAGKYKWGQVVTVHGLMEGYPGLYSINLGPPYKGLTVFVRVRHRDNNGLYPPVQTIMTVRGEYAGHSASAVSIENGVLISE